MAYLPPAGVRCLTNHKVSDLRLWREVPNRYHYVDRNKVPTASLHGIHGVAMPTPADLPSTSIKDEDWEIPQHKIFNFCPQGFTCTPPCPEVDFFTDYNETDIRLHKARAFREKYHQTYDVRMKMDWLGYWQNETLKYIPKTVPKNYTVDPEYRHCYWKRRVPKQPACRYRC